MPKYASTTTAESSARRFLLMQARTGWNNLSWRRRELLARRVNITLTGSEDEQESLFEEDPGDPDGWPPIFSAIVADGEEKMRARMEKSENKTVESDGAFFSMHISCSAVAFLMAHRPSDSFERVSAHPLWTDSLSSHGRPALVASMESATFKTSGEWLRKILARYPGSRIRRMLGLPDDHPEKPSKHYAQSLGFIAYYAERAKRAPIYKNSPEETQPPFFQNVEQIKEIHQLLKVPGVFRQLTGLITEGYAKHPCFFENDLVWMLERMEGMYSRSNKRDKRRKREGSPSEDEAMQERFPHELQRIYLGRIIEGAAKALRTNKAKHENHLLFVKKALRNGWFHEPATPRDVGKILIRDMTPEMMEMFWDFMYPSSWQSFRRNVDKHEAQDLDSFKINKWLVMMAAHDDCAQWLCQKWAEGAIMPERSLIKQFDLKVSMKQQTGEQRSAMRPITPVWEKASLLRESKREKPGHSKEVEVSEDEPLRLDKKKARRL